MPKNKSNKERAERKMQPSFETFALADIQTVFPESNVSVPTEIGVIAAKNWVDHNAK